MITRQMYALGFKDSTPTHYSRRGAVCKGLHPCLHVGCAGVYNPPNNQRMVCRGVYSPSII